MNGELFAPSSVTRLAPAYFDQVERRADAASPGPWLQATGPYRGENWLLATITLGNSNEDGEDHEIHITTDQVHASEMYGDAKSDADFIAHARTDVPNLLTALRAEHARREAAEARVRELEDEVASLFVSLGQAH